MMVRTVFEEVVVKGHKSGKCGCGKMRKRVMKFWQTISPFNKNPDGSLKTHDDICKELIKERMKWFTEPIFCDACRPEKTL